MVKNSLDSPSLPADAGSAAFAGPTPSTVVLDAGTAAQLIVPNGALLLVADYVREGPDLPFDR